MRIGRLKSWKARLGDLWWYSILMFAAQRFIAVFMEKKQYGKAKALIRDAVVGSVVFTAVVLPERIFGLVASFDPCRLSVVVWYLCATQLAIGSMLVVSAIRRRMLYSDF